MIEKKQKIIQAILDKKITKQMAATELNLSLRQVNRLLAAYKEKG